MAGLQRTICIHAARGGTGKTHIVANVAARLATQGYHVGVVDLDLYNPALHVLFGITPPEKTTINELVWDETTLEEAVIDITAEVAARYPDAGVDRGQLLFIPANHNVTRLWRLWDEGYDVGLLHIRLNEFVTRFALDFLLLDSHAGFQQETLVTANQAELMLSVTGPDQQHLNCTLHLMDAINRIGEPPPVALIISKAPPYPRIPQEFFDQCEAQSIATMPLSKRLAMINSQGLFALKQPNHPWSQNLNDVVYYILTHLVPYTT